MPPSFSHSVPKTAFLISSRIGIQAFALAMAGIFMVWGIQLFVLGYDKSFIQINALGSTWSDPLVYWLTHLGDTGVAGALIVLFFWRKDPGPVLVALLALTITGVCTQLLKNFVFSDWQRPLSDFAKESFRYGLSYDMTHNSFPSGHATTCGAAGVFWASRSRTFWQGLLVALGVTLIMLTRVWLGVHYLGDILAGGLLGVLLSFAFIGTPYLKHFALKVNQWPRLMLNYVGWALYVVSFVWMLNVLLDYLELYS